MNDLRASVIVRVIDQNGDPDTFLANYYSPTKIGLISKCNQYINHVRRQVKTISSATIDLDLEGWTDD